MNSLYFAITRAIYGQDEMFNKWYSEKHIFDILSIDGICSAQRFIIEPFSAKCRPKYVAIYELSEVRVAVQNLLESVR